MTIAPGDKCNVRIDKGSGTHSLHNVIYEGTWGYPTSSSAASMTFTKRVGGKTRTYIVPILSIAFVEVLPGD